MSGGNLTMNNGVKLVFSTNSTLTGSDALALNSAFGVDDQDVAD